MAPRIFCCINIWTCNMLKQRTEPLLKIFYSSFMQSFILINTRLWACFMKKAKRLTKIWQIHFFKRLHLDQIQINDQNLDAVDHFLQHHQSLHGPIPCAGLSYHLATLLSFDLYAAYCLIAWLHYFTYASACISIRSLVSACFDPDVQYSFGRWVITPPTIHQKLSVWKSFGTRKAWKFCHWREKS